MNERGADGPGGGDPAGYEPETGEELSPDDLETIAAFLDGTLSPDERARARRLLARSPAAFEVFADAAALGDQEALVSQPDGPPAAAIRKADPARWRHLGTLGLLAAAGIAGVMLLPGGAEDDPVSMASDLVGRQGVAAPLALPTWPSRGVDPGAVESSVRLQAFRVGVRLTDLAVAQAAGDAAAVRISAGDLSTLVESLEGSAALVAYFSAVPSSPESVPETLPSVVETISEVYRAQGASRAAAFQAGIRAETLRLALASDPDRRWTEYVEALSEAATGLEEGFLRARLVAVTSALQGPAPDGGEAESELRALMSGR